VAEFGGKVPGVGAREQPTARNARDIKLMMERTRQKAPMEEDRKPLNEKSLAFRKKRQGIQPEDGIPALFLAKRSLKSGVRQVS